MEKIRKTLSAVADVVLAYRPNSPEREPCIWDADRPTTAKRGRETRRSLRRFRLYSLTESSAKVRIKSRLSNYSPNLPMGCISDEMATPNTSVACGTGWRKQRANWNTQT